MINGESKWNHWVKEEEEEARTVMSKCFYQNLRDWYDLILPNL